jgi:sterol 3beta-glucosyltransferase
VTRLGLRDCIVTEGRLHHLQDILLEAVAKTGVRALISMGWSGLGGRTLPSNVFALGECGSRVRIRVRSTDIDLVLLSGDVPHDWLFAEGRVSAVCIHGGAGTMAIALKNGLPTIVGESAIESG